MKPQELTSFKKTIAQFKKRSVLIIGDLILDEFIWGDVSRISPEAPVPVVWAKRESFMPGGACNVAANINSLGGRAVLVGVTGNDATGSRLRDELKRAGITVDGVIMDPARPTTLKTRVVAQRQQVVRIDREAVQPLPDETADRLVSYVRNILGQVDAIIIEDYGKGVIAPSLLKRVISLAKAKKKIIAVDPKEEHFLLYKGASLITPNQHEAAKAVDFALTDNESLDRAGKKILDILGCSVVILTLGERGMRVFQRGASPRHIPTVAKEVYDVSGAGDTVIATFTLAYSCGASPVSAARIANCAAGIVVGKFGTAVVTPAELIEAMRWSRV